MAKKIQDYQTKNGTATSMACCIDKYDLEGDNLQVSYSLRNSDNEQIETDILTFGLDVINSWGAVNDPIWTAVAEKKGIIFI